MKADKVNKIIAPRRAEDPVMILTDNREIERLIDEAALRTGKIRVTTRTWRTEGQRFVNLVGLLGEEAVAQYLKVSRRRSTKIPADPGYDLIAGGRKIEVKTTTHETGHLIFDDGELDRAAIVILAVVTLDMGYGPGCTFREAARLNDGFQIAARLAGWLPVDAAKKYAVIKDFGYGPRNSIEQRALCPMTELKKRCHLALDKE